MNNQWWRQEFGESLVQIVERQPSSMRELLGHLLLNPGQWLRPHLVFSSAAIWGECGKQVFSVARAVELVHTYSLIHDDLPVMDDDMERRDREATHIVFGEAAAILAGDGLLALAFEELAAAGGEHTAAMVSLLAKASGPSGLVYGQREDLLGVCSSERIARYKTGALFEACVLLGQQVMGQEGHHKLLGGLGSCLGVIYQLKDDVIDGEATDTSMICLAARQEELRVRVEECLAVEPRFAPLTAVMLEIAE